MAKGYVGSQMLLIRQTENLHIEDFRITAREKGKKARKCELYMG
jgi:hypothetical protein